MKPFDTLVQWLTDRMDNLAVPGAAVGVSLGDQRFTSGIGVANAETGEPFTPSTLVGIASLTKIFTATTLATLVQESALTLDDPVRRFLPGLRLADAEAADAVTVGDLLSHAVGWADFIEPDLDHESLEWYASQMGDLPQITPPGSRFSYSNSAYLLAGGVIERVSHDSYEKVIAKTILRPLHMSRSGFSTEANAGAGRALGHQTEDGMPVVLPLAAPIRAINPAAGLLSNVDEMLTFVQAHTAADGSALNPDALTSMQIPRIAGGSIGSVIVTSIATGWMELTIDEEHILMSQGGDAGLISAMVAVPARQFGMVLLTNSDAALTLVNDAVLQGLASFLALSLPEPTKIELAPAQVLNAAGRFGLPGWLSFDINRSDGSLQLETSADGEVIPSLSGPITMSSAAAGFIPFLGGRFWLDLVPDESGAIQWIRCIGRLVPRLEEQ